MECAINAEQHVRDVIVIGASEGGVAAVIELLSCLPAELPATVGVAIHRGAWGGSDWSDTLGSKTRLRVIEPADGDPLVRGVVYIAPADFHLTFAKGRCCLERGRKVHHTRPAIDPLFTSAAREYKTQVVGVVLTGGGEDGLQGLLDIKAAGGMSLVQTPVEAQNSAMPENAIIRDHVDAMLSVEEIGDALVQLARGSMVLVRDIDIPRRRARALRG